MSRSVPHSLFYPWGPGGSLSRKELRARYNARFPHSSNFRKVSSHLTLNSYSKNDETQAPRNKQLNKESTKIGPGPRLRQSPSSFKVDRTCEPSLMMGAIKKRDSFHLLDYPNTPKVVQRASSKVQIVRVLDNGDAEQTKNKSNKENMNVKSRLLPCSSVEGENLEPQRSTSNLYKHNQPEFTEASGKQDGLVSFFNPNSTGNGRTKLSPPSNDGRSSLTTRPQSSTAQRESRV